MRKVVNEALVVFGSNTWCMFTAHMEGDGGASGGLLLQGSGEPRGGSFEVMNDGLAAVYQHGAGQAPSRMAKEHRCHHGGGGDGADLGDAVEDVVAQALGVDPPGVFPLGVHGLGDLSLGGMHSRMSRATCF